MSFPVAIQMYSLRQDASKNLYGTLKKVKELGYDGVEFAGLYGHTTEEVRDMCADVGLVPISAHVPYVDMLADPEGVLSQYATIGCKFVVVPYLVPEHRPDSDNFPEVIKNIAMIGGVANKLGLTLLYHNHDFEFMKLNGKYALDVLYEEVSADLLQTELDMCWVNVGGENPAEYLLKYSGRSPVVHLKDFNGEKSDDMYELIGIEKKAPARPANFEFRPVGSGKQDFPAILKAAEKAGAEWVVVEQDQPSMGLTPMECATKSREYLKSIGTKLGTVHIHDTAYKSGSDDHRLVGDGDIATKNRAWGEIYKTLLIDNGYRGVFMFEPKDNQKAADVMARYNEIILPSYKQISQQ
jgi:sugar phosphate isomerase/epimerase